VPFQIMRRQLLLSPVPVLESGRASRIDMALAQTPLDSILASYSSFRLLWCRCGPLSARPTQLPLCCWAPRSFTLFLTMAIASYHERFRLSKSFSIVLHLECGLLTSSSQSGINAVTGSNPQSTPVQTAPAPTTPSATVQAAALASTSDTPVPTPSTNMPTQSYDTYVTPVFSIPFSNDIGSVTQSTTNTWSITTVSGSVPNPAATFSPLDVLSSSSSTTSAAAGHGSLAPAPIVATSQYVNTLCIAFKI
jgi:hypothetical protein